jgi:hypothetical protein
MPGQVIGTVNVQVNKQQNQTVRQLNYGIRSLQGSTDLSLVNVQNDDVIVYQANTNSFVVKSVQDAVEDGELAYSFVSNTLFIGTSNSQIIQIGGPNFIANVTINTIDGGIFT